MTDSIAVNARDKDSRRERMSSLLRRYPELLGDEIEELIVFYKTAPAIETALLTCENDVAGKARQFLTDNAAATSRGLEAPLVLVVLALCSVVIMFALAFHLSA